MTDSEKVTVQRVRFTGKRTGLESIPIKGFGRVSQGQTIEVTAEEAERYTAKVPMRDGDEGSDFTKVGGEYEVERSELMNRRFASRDKLATEDERLDDIPGEVNTEPAHETLPDKGTVEEYAEVVLTEPEPEVEAEAPKRGRTKSR